MKTIAWQRGMSCLPLVLFFLSGSGNAQSIQLEFTGRLAGQYVPLDSIRVGNLTQFCDTTLYWPDTSLLLLYASLGGQVLSGSDFSLGNAQPNPFREACAFSVNLPAAGKTVVIVSDIYGRRVHVFADQLGAGMHAFRFTSSTSGVYFVQARFESRVLAMRLVSLGGGSGRGSSLQLESQNGGAVSVKAAVSTLAAFLFAPGDTLLCLGFAAGDTAGFTDVPFSSENYTFHFGEGYPCPQAPLLSYGGQLYQTVQIGTQCWMRQNLNIGVKVFSSISGLPHSDCSNSGFIEKYCFNNDTAFCSIYGGLYDWNEMMGYSATPGVQGICAPGWHVPTDEEWCVLTSYLDTAVNCTSWGFSGANAGAKLKETGFVHWVSPNTGATNESGFTALAGGNRTSDGYFVNLGNNAGFWSSTINSTINSISRIMFYNNARVSRSNYHKATGLAVRCIKNN
ncbi:MAG TPA: FISUMP domain-containing protein [Bacteroidales bacterium]|nr:FISUMP domain-containing protein [Bacteroidales bacterium]